jgi:hypothetical protein
LTSPAACDHLRVHVMQFPQLAGIGAGGGLGQGPATPGGGGCRLMPISPFQDAAAAAGGGPPASSHGLPGLRQQPQPQPPPPGISPMHAVQLGMEGGPGGYMPLGNLPPPFHGYPQPMQIPPGYALVPAQPGLPSVPPVLSPRPHNPSCHSLVILNSITSPCRQCHTFRTLYAALLCRKAEVSRLGHLKILPRRLNAEIQFVRGHRA